MLNAYIIYKENFKIMNMPAPQNRPIRLTQCFTQFRSLGVKVLCVFHLHGNIPFTFKWYGNTWNKTFYSQRIWIGYNIELAELVYPPNPLAHDQCMSGVMHKLFGNFSCRRLPGPAPALPPTPFHRRNHDSVSLVELGLLKFGRCHHCCIAVKGAKRKETRFGCRSCMKHLCRSGCHEQYHRQQNIV